MERYEKLRQVLDTHISRAPASDHLDKILQILFPERDIEVALGLSFRAKSAVDVSKETGISTEEVTSRLEAMVKRGVIHRREKEGQPLYSLLPLIPGLFEFPYMKNDDTLDLDRLGELWALYHSESMSAAFSGNPTPAMRVLPVEASLKGESQVLLYEEAKALVSGADVVAVSRCACRASLKRCDGPLETCLTFNGIARHLAGIDAARIIDQKEALTILRECDEAGLVHNVENHRLTPSIICNCCPCCCTILRGRTEVGHPHAFAPSSYRASVDKEACTECLVCVDERCPVEAISTTDGLMISEEKCIGCGLCATTCPVDAISMVKRENYQEPPADVKEMGMQIMTEKDVLKDFIEKGRK